MGASYPALEYFQPLYEYVANATKIKGSHTIRFGVDVNFEHMRHIEDRNNTFTFTGSATTLNGGPAPTRTTLSATSCWVTSTKGRTGCRFSSPISR